MGLKGSIAIILGSLLLCLSETLADSQDSLKFHSSLENFSKDIFSEIYQKNSDKSIIFSPFSIQTCLAMVRMGADGETAAEMDDGLSLTGQPVEKVVDNYHTILSKYDDGKTLKIANKIYVAKDYDLKDTYNNVLTNNFYSAVENVDFGQGAKTAKLMNSWVESKTDNTIHDIVSPTSLTTDTRLVLLSAIYFKGNWEKPFDLKYTEEEDFYIDDKNTVKVQMMFKSGMMSAKEISELDATAIRLPYRDCDLSMVIILPNERNGLPDLVEKLKTFSLASLAGQGLRRRGVRLFLPKFKAEFEVVLNEPLKKLGMKQMFSQANLSNMLQGIEPLQVSDVVHKAFIDVNEVGTTAAGVTKIGIMTRTRPLDFRANHPFYYAIVNENSVPLFQGTFVGK
ncbi:serine protease inhibitor 42Dd [Musca domestica]|uniref:Serine protease inhibitor 42Dd n=2 Tax=Musca domestica TaxID=7370 RepID=A0A9J7D5F3_MUSDO|nr:serine protease inhibitor 42Dd [Musca domestica]